MAKIIDYNYGEDKGAIIVNDEHSYIAVTVATSKTFRSLKGAEKYMSKFDYKKTQKRNPINTYQDQLK